MSEELVTAYAICGLPVDHDLFEMYAVTVRWRGGHWYAVEQAGGRRLQPDGSWGWCPYDDSGDKEEEWLASTRYPFAVAVELARRAAGEITVNGHTAAQVLASGLEH